MKLKFVRTVFIWVFTAFFAFIVTMGEGLHFLPGMGHSLEHSHDLLFHSTIADIDGCNHHTSVIKHSDKNQDGTNNADDCVVCKFITHAKNCLLTVYFVVDYTTITWQLAVYSPLLESRFVGTYHSRAPPCGLSQG